MNLQGISIIVCCYNSASRLPETLKHLSQQVFCSSLKWEIIFVDNASTDNTVDIIRNEWEKYSLPHINLKILSEPNPGLSHARMKGVNEAVYEYLIFCDDDNWLSNNYISTAFDLMEKNKGIGILCGSSLPAHQSLPIWFTTYQSDYAVGVQGLNSGDISERGFCWGAGMVLRKSVLHNLHLSGFKSMLSDRKGQTISSGGDSEICKWFLIAGYKIWYEETLTFYHDIPAARLTKNYLHNLWESFQDSYKHLDYYDYFIYFKNKEIKSSIKYLKLPYHFIKWSLLKNLKSKLFILSIVPRALVKKLDFKYFLIRHAAKEYELKYQ